MFPASMDMDIRLIDSIPMNKKGEIIMPFLLKMTIKKNIYDIWLALQAHLKKRASSFLLKKTRGSMTVEAAFVIPFFLFAASFSLFAQTNTVTLSHYLLPEFQEGRVLMKNQKLNQK